MKIINRSVQLRIFLFGFIILIFNIYNYYRVYTSISVSISENKKLEYGYMKNDFNNVIDEISGNVVSVVKDVDINQIGLQEVILEVEKFNIKREIPVTVEVVDTNFPIINIKENVVNIKSGVTYDIFDNILSVVDLIDGDLIYKPFNDINTNDVNYYTVSGNLDVNNVGIYPIKIKAVDKTGNSTIKYFDVKVNSNGKEKNLVSTAYSLLGKPYVFGSNGPFSFDCSGFVQYVYSNSGIKVSRNASTQIMDGYEVSYENMNLGDILIWGYDRQHITHSSIYVGDGLMIHAANPNQGVIIDNVSTWGNSSNISLLSVRRL